MNQSNKQIIDKPLRPSTKPANKFDCRLLAFYNRNASAHLPPPPPRVCDTITTDDSNRWRSTSFQSKTQTNIGYAYLNFNYTAEIEELSLWKSIAMETLVSYVNKTWTVGKTSM
jgi:hypothetical protein